MNVPYSATSPTLCGCVPLGVSVKQETKRPKVSSPSSKKPVSVDQIRRSVRDALKDILLKRSLNTL